MNNQEKQIVNVNDYSKVLNEFIYNTINSDNHDGFVVKIADVQSTFGSSYRFFTEYCTDIRDLSKKHIEYRLIVVKNFLFYKKIVLEAILQKTNIFKDD